MVKFLYTERKMTFSDPAHAMSKWAVCDPWCKISLTSVLCLINLKEKKSLLLCCYRLSAACQRSLCMFLKVLQTPGSSSLPLLSVTSCSDNFLLVHRSEQNFDTGLGILKRTGQELLPCCHFLTQHFTDWGGWLQSRKHRRRQWTHHTQETLDFPHLYFCFGILE